MTEPGKHDWLAEIEGKRDRRLYAFPGVAHDIDLLIEEVKRLRGFLAYLKGVAQDADNVKLMDQIDEVLTGA